MQATGDHAPPETSPSHGQGKLALGLAIAILLDTLTQILWKIAASEVPATASVWEAARAGIRQPLFAAVVVLMVGRLVNWLNVLRRAELSFVQPITSLSYVTVMLLSGLYLGERIEGGKIVGVAMVMAGVWCISRSRSTVAPNSVAPP